MTECVCCKRKPVNKSGALCDNCWHWITKQMTITDIAVVVAGIHNREPDNIHAKEICQYLIADNYMQGKATLGSKK